MKMHKKIISVILIIGLLAGSVSVNPVEAKMVEVKTKGNSSGLKISLLNEQLDYKLKEVAFKIKNKTNKKIKVTRVNVQFKSQGKWTNLKKRKKSVSKRATVIDAGNTVYDSVNLNTDYVISTDGLVEGKYSIYIRYKHNGKYFNKRKTFFVEGKEKPTAETIKEETVTTEKTIIEDVTSTPEETTSADDVTSIPKETTSETESVTTSNSSEVVTTFVDIQQCPTIVTTTTEPQNSMSTTVDKSTATANGVKVKIVNTDFSINKNGKASIMVFSEADYKKAKKAKIYISIQRKTKEKWKKYKNFKVIKKSNIAFINKQIRIKKRGTYRMWVKITFYANGKKRKQYSKKSKVQIY